jgi:hypothetical protein
MKDVWNNLKTSHKAMIVLAVVGLILGLLSAG